jgi:hypothetical protein
VDRASVLGHLHSRQCNSCPTARAPFSASTGPVSRVHRFRDEVPGTRRGAIRMTCSRALHRRPDGPICARRCTCTCHEYRGLRALGPGSSDGEAGHRRPASRRRDDYRAALARYVGMRQVAWRSRETRRGHSASRCEGRPAMLPAGRRATNARFKHGDDERMSQQRLRTDRLLHAGATGDAGCDTTGAASVHPLAVRHLRDQTVEAFTDGQIARSPCGSVAA